MRSSCSTEKAQDSSLLLKLVSTFHYVRLVDSDIAPRLLKHFEKSMQIFSLYHTAMP